jgi:negative regulator of flagellin synthesis FlgM
MKLEKHEPVVAVPVVSNAARAEKTNAAADSAPQRVQSEPKTAATPAPAQGVSVYVSRAAISMAQAPRSSVADVDQKKVDSVRSAIEKKTFKVNAEAIADKMLSNAEEMLNRKLN